MRAEGLRQSVSPMKIEHLQALRSSSPGSLLGGDAVTAVQHVHPGHGAVGHPECWAGPGQEGGSHFIRALRGSQFGDDGQSGTGTVLTTAHVTHVHSGRLSGATPAEHSRLSKCRPGPLRTEAWGFREMQRTLGLERRASTVGGLEREQRPGWGQVRMPGQDLMLEPRERRGCRAGPTRLGRPSGCSVRLAVDRVGKPAGRSQGALPVAERMVEQRESGGP